MGLLAPQRTEKLHSAGGGGAQMFWGVWNPMQNVRTLGKLLKYPPKMTGNDKLKIEDKMD